MATVNYDGNDLVFISSSQPSTSSQISLLGSNGLSYRSSKVQHLRVESDDQPSNSTQISLLGTNGTEYRSSKVRFMRVDDRLSANQRQADGVAWPRGTQRFGNS